ncbi:MAG: uroporphyrinogen decarboxylase family protein, partial [Deltaproteobacteria bacterium]|nr:uroporphyrinogen decarboxylase family protein [Deltaproteobacteria bacterium]
NTVAGKPVDRPAYTLTLSLYGARLTGCPLREYYTDPAAYVAGQCAVREMFQPDLLFSPFVLTALGEAFGSNVAYFDHYPPNLTRPAARSAEEAAAMPLPDIDTHPRLLFLREAVRRLAARYRGEVPIVGVMVGPGDLPPLIMGLDAWYEALLFNEETARLVLEKSCRFFIDWGNALLADGAAFLALPDVFSNPTVMPRRVVRDLAMPALAASFGEIRGPIVIHHGGSRLAPFIRDYTGLPNVVGFVVDARDSLAEARQGLGVAPVLLGNIDGPTLHQASPEQLQARCARILADRAQDPHFILATSAADVAWDTSPELIQVVSRMVQESGKEGL